MKGEYYVTQAMFWVFSLLLLYFLVKIDSVVGERLGGHSQRIDSLELRIEQLQGQTSALGR